MQIISGTKEFGPLPPAAVAIGKFDGVHRGHRKLLGELLARKSQGLCAAILTFSPAPETFFGIGDGYSVTTQEEKRRIFGAMGIDLLIEYPFDRETANTLPEAFVHGILRERMNAQFIAAGPDLSYGRKGAGNYELLRAMGEKEGFETMCVEKLRVGGEIVSSSRIRALLREGRMEEVNECLGRPYSILGTIRHGKELGRTIGIPTINQVPEVEKLLPPRGVYYSIVTVNGRAFPGMTNIGVRPTVSGDGVITAETHLFDFSGDLYGATAQTDLLHFRRPEKRFRNLAELKAAMEADIRAGREMFSEDFACLHPAGVVI